MKKPKKKRRPTRLSEADAQRLGFRCRDIDAADAEGGLSVGLGKYLGRHPRIRRAYDRGRLLRSLVELAPVATIHDAARQLKQLGYPFSRGQDLRDFLDGDPEANELWESARVNGWIDVRRSLFDAAKDGSAKAIAMVEKWAIDRQAESDQIGTINFSRIELHHMTELFDVTRQTIHDWTTTKGLPKNLDGSYDLPAAIKWFERFVTKKAIRGREPMSADKLRELKAEDKALDIAERRGQLLDRDEVVAGLVARWQQLVTSFNRRRRELAQMLHGQTIERIVDLLDRFFEDLQRDQLDLPEFLDLPDAAADKLAACLEILATKPKKSKG